MNKVVIKKTNQPWKYCVMLNGLDLPFVGDVEIIKEVGSMPKALITMFIPPNPVAGYEVILDENPEE